MYVVAVRFTIVAQHVAAFIPLVLENATASRGAEGGCRRFDVCQDPAHPESVFLYEVYASRAAFDEHLKTAHFQSFDRAIAGMVVDKQAWTYDLLNP
jgi:autoinducer 2-degrading protein